MRWRERICDAFIGSGTTSVASHTPNMSSGAWIVATGGVDRDGANERAVPSNHNAGNRINFSLPFYSNECLLRGKFDKGASTAAADAVFLGLRAAVQASSDNWDGIVTFGFDFSVGAAGSFTMNGLNPVGEAWGASPRVLELRLYKLGSGIRGSYLAEGYADGVLKISAIVSASTNGSPGTNNPDSMKYMGFTLLNFTNTAAKSGFLYWIQGYERVQDLGEGEIDLIPCWIANGQQGAHSRIRRDPVTGYLWQIGEMADNNAGNSPFFVRKSTDGGDTWTHPKENTTLLSTAASVQALILYGAFYVYNDVLHVLINTDYTASPGGDLVYYKGTISGGTITWASGINLTTQMGGAAKYKAHRGAVVADGTYVHVFCTVAFNSADRAVQYFRSTNNGTSFTNSVELGTEAAGTGGPLVSSPYLDGRGRIHAVWNTYPNGSTANERIAYRRSTDNGATWDTIVQFDLYTLRPYIAGWEGGEKLVIACENDPSQDGGTDQVVNTYHSGDGGVTWTAKRRSTSQTRDMDHNVTIMSAEGVVHTIVRSGNAGEGPVGEDFIVFGQNGGADATWSAPQQITSNALAVGMQPYSGDRDDTYMHVMLCTPVDSPYRTYYMRRRLEKPTCRISRYPHIAGLAASL